MSRKNKSNNTAVTAIDTSKRLVKAPPGEIAPRVDESPDRRPLSGGVAAAKDESTERVGIDRWEKEARLVELEESQGRIVSALENLTELASRDPNPTASPAPAEEIAIPDPSVDPDGFMSASMAKAMAPILARLDKRDAIDQRKAEEEAATRVNTSRSRGVQALQNLQDEYSKTDMGQGYYDRLGNNMENTIRGWAQVTQRRVAMSTFKQMIQEQYNLNLRHAAILGLNPAAYIDSALKMAEMINQGHTNAAIPVTGQQGSSVGREIDQLNATAGSASAGTIGGDTPPPSGSGASGAVQEILRTGKIDSRMLAAAARAYAKENGIPFSDARRAVLQDINVEASR